MIKTHYSFTTDKVPNAGAPPALGRTQRAAEKRHYLGKSKVRVCHSEDQRDEAEPASRRTFRALCLPAGIWVRCVKSESGIGNRESERPKANPDPSVASAPQDDQKKQGDRIPVAGDRKGKGLKSNCVNGKRSTETAKQLL